MAWCSVKKIAQGQLYLYVTYKFEETSLSAVKINKFAWDN